MGKNKNQKLHNDHQEPFLYTYITCLTPGPPVEDLKILWGFKTNWVRILNSLNKFVK